MKRLWTLPIFSLAIASAPTLGNPSAIAATLFQANINVEQEVCSKPDKPCPTQSNATGVFSATLNDAETSLSYTYQLNNLDLGSSIDQSQTDDPNDDIFKVHIHAGAPGVAGPVVFSPLDLVMGEQDNDLSINVSPNSLGGTVSGVWTASEGLTEQLAALKSGQLYVNIHSFRFVDNGEIRGQITSAAQPTATPEPTMLLGLALIGGTGLLLRQRQQNPTR